LLKNLESDFALKDLEELHYFLGIEVTKTKEGILLTQLKYATELLKRASMFGCKSCAMSLSTSDKLSTHIGDLLGLNDATNY
jgi:hypothetical protein